MKKQGTSSVAIVIVNFNGRDLLELCLPALFRSSYPKEKIKVIVVDNGSSDDSVLWIKKKFPIVTIIRKNVNVGFAKANNEAISHILKEKLVEYVCALNNDAIVDKNWLENLVKFMEKNKTVGIGVGKILQYHNIQLIDSAGDFFCKNGYRVINRGHGKKDAPIYNKTREILSACAAACIFRRETLQQIKIGKEYFDEDFVSYIEDVDLCIRARLYKWKIYYIPDALVYHIGSATSSRISKSYKEYVSRRNRLLLVVKNFPLKQALFLIPCYIFPSQNGIDFYRQRNVKTITAINENRKKLKKSFSYYLKKVFTYYVWDKKDLSVIHICFIQLHAIFSALIMMPKMIGKRKIISSKKMVSSNQIEQWLTTLSIYA